MGGRADIKQKRAAGVNREQNYQQYNVREA
jgi:hypothetical protein